MPNSQVLYLFFVHFSQLTQNLLPFLSIYRSVGLHTVVAVICFVAYTVDIQDAAPASILSGNVWLQSRQFPSDATFVRRSASEMITYLIAYLKAAGYVCEQSERHIEPRLKKQRDTAGQSEQPDRDTAGIAAGQP